MGIKNTQSIRFALRDLKSVPIEMKDRRVLYTDLENLENFRREIRGKAPVRNTIPCFRFRLFWRSLMHYFESYEVWQSSLREIEIKRGTIIANVFYFIKSTLFFNLWISVIILLVVFIPHVIMYGGTQKGDDDHFFNCSGFNGTVAPAAAPPVSNATAAARYPRDYLAGCCHMEWENVTHRQVEITAQSMFRKVMLVIINFIGGESTWQETPFVYGYYTSHWIDVSRYPLPFLYAMAVILVLMFSFCVLVRSVAYGVQDMVRFKDSDVCVFSDLIFCGFDGRCKNESEARYRRKLWIHNLRIAIKQSRAWGRSRNKYKMLLLVIRVLCFLGTVAAVTATTILIFILSGIAYDQVDLLKDSKNMDDIVLFVSYSLLPSVSVSVSNIVLPVIFFKVSSWERYGTETTTVLQLYRTLFVRLLSMVVSLSRIFDSDIGCAEVLTDTCIVCKKGDHKRNGCWESILAGELYKILFMDLAVKVIITVVVQNIQLMVKKAFHRVRIISSNLTLTFNVVRHSLDIINIQVICWLGFYFAPGYPLAVCFYLFVMFYIKKYSALHQCTGAPEYIKVTRTTTIFTSGKFVAFFINVVFLMTMFFYIQPSRGCGPFSIYAYAWDAVEEFFTPKSGWIIKSILLHSLSFSVCLPIIIVSGTLMYYQYIRKTRFVMEAESMQELVLLINEDKQYLVSKLKYLRFRKLHKRVYDPTSIYKSETKLTAYRQERYRMNLDQQWADLKSAALPPGVDPKKRKSLNMEDFTQVVLKDKRRGKAKPKKKKKKKLKRKTSIKIARIVSRMLGRRGSSDSDDDDDDDYSRPDTETSSVASKGKRHRGMGEEPAGEAEDSPRKKKEATKSSSRVEEGSLGNALSQKKGATNKTTGAQASRHKDPLSEAGEEEQQNTPHEPHKKKKTKRKTSSHISFSSDLSINKPLAGTPDLNIKSRQSIDIDTSHSGGAQSSKKDHTNKEVLSTRSRKRGKPTTAPPPNDPVTESSRQQGPKGPVRRWNI